LFHYKDNVWWKRTFLPMAIPSLCYVINIWKWQASAPTPGVFPLDLVFLHFIECSGIFSQPSSVFFMSELNVFTQFCLIVTRIEALISWNCNLLNILPTNYILNYIRAYNLFRVKPLRSHCGHLLKISVIYSRLQIQALLLQYISFSLSPVFKCLCLHCNVFSGHFLWV